MPDRGTPDTSWISLGRAFPCTLNKDSAPESLADNESPEAYGLGLAYPGYLYPDASPSTGTAWTGISTVSAPTYAPATCTWRVAYNRLWGYVTSAGSNILYYGDHGYDTNYFIRGLGHVPCDYESSVITNVVPFGGGNIAVFKSAHLYVIRNADNPGNSFTSEFVQQNGLPTALDVITMDGMLVWANTSGIFAYNGQNITELTAPIRSSLAPFYSTSLTSFKGDFDKKRIIGMNSTTTKCIIELGDKPMLYDYSTSGFRWTSKTLVADDSSPLLVDKVGIVYKYTATDRASITLGVKINDTWKTEDAFAIRPDVDGLGNGWAEIPIKNYYACRKFALRITALSSSFYISAIMVHLKQGGSKGYANK